MFRVESSEAVSRYGSHLSNILANALTEASQLKREVLVPTTLRGASSTSQTLLSSLLTEAQQLSKSYQDLYPHLDVTSAHHLVSDSSALFSVISSVLSKLDTRLGLEPPAPLSPVPRDTAVPKGCTPRMEHFGISLDELRRLGVEKEEQQSQPQFISDEDDVLKTLDDLKIQTAEDLSEKYRDMRKTAVNVMMATPGKQGPDLAKAYQLSAKKLKFDDEDDHLQNLNQRDRVIKTIRDGFSNLGFWKSRVKCEALENAAHQLLDTGETEWSKEQLSHIGAAVLVCLNKLGLLKLEIVQGQKTYKLVQSH